MKNKFTTITYNYFRGNADFRVQIFNTLGFMGFVLGVTFGIFSSFVHPNFTNVISNFGAAIVAAAVIIFANKTGKFKLCFMITVLVVFFLLFPMLFFLGGGIASGMPSFFVFAVVFTVIMLEGKRRAVLTILEIALYAACLLTAYFYPGTVVPFLTESDMLTDMIVAYLASCVVLAIAIYQHITVYDRKQKELETANASLHGLNRMKTEFLQDIKHEVRNPLHVISLGADYIHDRIDKEDGAAEAHAALTTVQNEAMRLGRMINGMVEMATMSGGVIMNRERVDFAALLRDRAEAFRLKLKEKNNNLIVNIPADLPFVYAEVDQISRVPVNLLSNAADSTKNGDITLDASAEDDYITVRVSDTGEGVPAEILPRIFDRGISGKGSKGYGLTICETIIEAHGGGIHVMSEHGKGTVVTFTIPVYGGQSETRDDE